VTKKHSEQTQSNHVINPDKLSTWRNYLPSAGPYSRPGWQHDWRTDVGQRRSSLWECYSCCASHCFQSE